MTSVHELMHHELKKRTQYGSAEAKEQERKLILLGNLGQFEVICGAGTIAVGVAGYCLLWLIEWVWLGGSAVFAFLPNEVLPLLPVAIWFVGGLAIIKWRESQAMREWKRRWETIEQLQAPDPQQTERM